MNSSGRARWENAGCYKRAAVAYGSIKLQNQGKENVLPHQLSCPIPSKGRGEVKVTLKHPPTSPALAPCSLLRSEPGLRLTVGLGWTPGLALLPDECSTGY